MLDTVIRNALIVDGSGSEPQTGELGIAEGRIVYVHCGSEPDGSRSQAHQVIDAGGRAVAPGFVDLHSHADFTILGAPAAETQLLQGVTTALVGNCGFSPFPTKDLQATIAQNAHLDATLPGEWQDAGGFAEALRLARPGINIALQVGLASVRTYVMGGEDRPPRADELAAMADEIAKAADAGVRGFSTGLIYAPASFAGTEEVRHLVAVAAGHGMLYSTHMRNESAQLLSAVDEAIATAEATGARLEISHLKAMGPENHGKTAEALERVDAARARGLDVAADVYPYTASSTTLTSRLPGFAMDGGAEALLRRLAEPSERARIAAGLAARFGRDVDPAGVVIADVAEPVAADYRWAVGLSLVDIGAREDCTPEEAAMRLLASHQGAVAIVNHAMSEDDVRGVLAHPMVSVASDGWTMTATGRGTPHPRSFGTFAKVLGEYVRERGVLSLAEAVRKMTSLPASRLGLTSRGLLKEGMVADIVVFDPQLIRENATFENPWRLASGVSDVLIGGSPVVAEGALTGTRAGQVL